MINVGKKAIKMGQHISVDEQTMGFEGNHSNIIRITFKAEGHGFQCDAICADGYTYSIYF